MIKATTAPTAEATTMVMEKAAKTLKKLDEKTTPKTGRPVEHVPDKQITQRTKKLSEPIGAE